MKTKYAILVWELVQQQLGKLLELLSGLGDEAGQDGCIHGGLNNAMAHLDGMLYSGQAGGDQHQALFDSLSTGDGLQTLMLDGTAKDAGAVTYLFGSILAATVKIQAASEFVSAISDSLVDLLDDLVPQLIAEHGGICEEDLGFYALAKVMRADRMAEMSTSGMDSVEFACRHSIIDANWIEIQNFDPFTEEE